MMLRRSVVGLAAAMALPQFAFAIVTNVSSVAELVAAMDYCNMQKSTGHTVVIAPGEYDVSAYSMSYKDTTGEIVQSPCHLAHDYITVRGETGDPRDVVIYGDGTKPIWYGYQGKIQSLTVSNGYATVEGAGIKSYNSILTVSNVVITCCTSTSCGGGACWGTYRDCVFAGCRANEGGGAYYSKCYGCTFTNNVAETAGGGVYKANCEDCLFVDNAATNGGGCYEPSGYFCTNCVIVGNRASGFGGGAGGANAHFYDCTIVSNRAGGAGGGVGGSERTASKVCFVHGGEIAHNIAVGRGGGANNTFFCERALVHHNATTGSSGGGIYADDGVVISNAVVSCNESLGSGGGIMAYKATVLNCIVSNNFANCSDGSIATVGGGGMYAGSSTVTGCAIVFNRLANENGTSAGRCFGAGIHSGTVSNCLIAGNATIPCATSTRQAAAYGSTLIDCVVRDNYVHGGPCGINGGSALRTTVENNWGTYAVRSVDSVRDCRIVGLITSSSLNGCRVTDYTNGICIAEGANVYTSGCSRCGDYLFENHVSATNCLISGNRINTLFRTKSTAGQQLWNCTVVDNEYTSNFFADLKIADSYFGFAENCIFLGNRKVNATTGKVTSTNDIAFTETQAPALTLVNCLIGTHRPSIPAGTETGTVTNDTPRFVMDGTADCYALRHSSPARGRGKVEDWMEGTTDIRGEARLREGRVDIGCYQCWLDPVGCLLLFR